MFFNTLNSTPDFVCGGCFFGYRRILSYSLSIWSCSALQPPTKFTPRLELLYNFYIPLSLLPQISHCIFCLFFFGWGRGCQSSPNQPLVPEAVFSHTPCDTSKSATSLKREAKASGNQWLGYKDENNVWNRSNTLNVSLVWFDLAGIHASKNTCDVTCVWFFFEMVLRKIN